MGAMLHGIVQYAAQCNDACGCHDMWSAQSQNTKFIYIASCGIPHTLFQSTV